MADYRPRRTEPGTRFGYTDPDGGQREIVADAGGLVVASNDSEEALLAGFELPFGHVGPKDRERDTPVVRKLTEDAPTQEG
jgi:hypothetical protein